MIEDGGIVVLGGLISDSATKGEQRVPFPRTDPDHRARVSGRVTPIRARAT